MLRICFWYNVPLAVCLVLSACSSPAPSPTASTPVLRTVAKTGTQSVLPVSSADQTVAQPVLKEGQKWAFRRVDLWRNEVVERFEQELRLKEGERWTVQWRITETGDPQRRGSITGEYMDGNSLAFFDPKATGRHIPLSFPLSVGKKWSFNYIYNPQAGRQLKIEQSATVAGWENVKVPAGSFRALKVVHEAIYHAFDAGLGSWTGRIQETYWYAPDARRVVKMEYRDTKGDGTTWDHWRDELVEMKL